MIKIFENVCAITAIILSFEELYETEIKTFIVNFTILN